MGKYHIIVTESQKCVTMVTEWSHHTRVTVTTCNKVVT